MTFPGIFALIVGGAMIGQWTLSYLNQRIPELRDEPIRIVFHILAEMVTAASLLVAGAGLLAGQAWARALYPVALGMLFYTCIVSPGYFAQKGDWRWLILFTALIGGGLIGLSAVL